MKKLITISVVALALSGCATNEYKLYADAQAAVETAKYTADAAKYKAMSDIAASGTESAKVAAVMAIALGNQSNAQSTRLQAPQASQALQWAQVLVPGLTQVAGMRYNYLSTQTQSNNSARVSESTNATFLGIAGKIQAPAANITTTTTTTSTDNHTQTLAGTGTLGTGAYSTTTDRNDQTLTGTGTLGSGAYNTTDSHTTDNHTTNPITGK